MPAASPVRRRPEVAASPKPRVCFVAPYVWPVLSRDPTIKIVGGAEVQQTILARLLARHGYQVSLVTIDYGQPDGVQVDGVTVYKTFRREEGIPVVRFLHPRLTSLWKAMRAADADIYYQRSADMLTGVVAEFARRHGRRAIYAGASDNDFERGKEQIRFSRDRWLYHYGIDHVHSIVVQNATQKENCLRQFGRESVLIPSCYELPADSKAGGGDLVLWVATVHEYKRPEWVLEIAKRLPHRRFVMIGGLSTRGTRLTPGYYEGIQAAAAQVPNIDFKGFLPLEQAEKWFDRAHVFLNTSVYEGMPNTFLQSWARGVPTVSTVDVGSGLYKASGTVEEAAGEVERLFTDQLHWARSAARCREYFDANHSPAEALARYERIFTDLRIDR